MPHTDSQHNQVLLFIRENPEGLRKRRIAEAFPSISKPTMSTILASLRNKNLIYNDGVMGAKGSIWYPRTYEGVSAPFPEIAIDLIAELREIHYAGHELHLARRLEELFGHKI